MQQIRSMTDLDDAIRLLEIEQASKGQLLKEQFNQTYESIRPVNILKSTVKEIGSSSNLINSLLGITLGLTSGYLSKVFFVGRSANSIRKLIGYVMQFGVTKFVAQNSQEIKKIGQLLLQKIFPTKEPNSESL